MKIDIHVLIEQKELELEEDINIKGLFSEDDGVVYLHADIKAVYSSKIVIIDGVLTGAVKKPCGRCLEAAEHEIEAHFHQDYEISPDDTAIIPDEDFRQAFLLAVPVKYLCSDSCKGLCQICGCNLNKVQCRCKKNGLTNPFGMLKDIFSKKSKEKK